MISLEEFASKDIRGYIHKDIPVYKPEDTVSKVLGELGPGKHNEVLVREGNKIGLVTLSNLLGIVQPNQTKIGEHPRDRWNVFRVVSPEYTVLEIVEKLVENRVRAIPVAEAGELSGFICQTDLLKGLNEVSEIKKEPVKNVAVMPLLTMPSNQNIAGARKMMLDHNISHIPVVDEGELKGMVTAENIVNRFIRPIGATTVGDVVGEKVPRFSGTLGDVMDDAVSVGPDATFNDVLDRMLRLNSDAVIQLTEDDTPIAIIPPRELLSVVFRVRGEDTMPVYITGLSDIGNFMERAVIEEKIRRVMKRATKIHPHLAETSIHIQTSSVEGNRSRYEISVNVISKATNERFAFKKEGWDVINIFDEISDALDRLLTESKHKPRGRSPTQKLIRFSLREKPN